MDILGMDALDDDPSDTLILEDNQSLIIGREKHDSYSYRWSDRSILMLISNIA